MKLLAPVVLLGQFYPTSYTEHGIREELFKYLKDRGHTPGFWITVRSPNRNKTLQADSSDKANQFHHDGDGDSVVTNGWILCLWSNTTPTEIREVGKEELINWVRPFDVVLIDNELCEHRVSHEPVEEDRWFARVIFPKLNG